MSMEQDHHEFAQVPDVRSWPHETYSYVKIQLPAEDIQDLRNGDQDLRNGDPNGPLRDRQLEATTKRVDLRKHRQVIKKLVWQPTGVVWGSRYSSRHYQPWHKLADTFYDELRRRINQLIPTLPPPGNHLQRIDTEMTFDVATIIVIAEAAITEHRIMGWEEYDPATGEGKRFTPPPSLTPTRI